MHLISCDPEHFRKKDKEMIDEDQFYPYDQSTIPLLTSNEAF